MFVFIPTAKAATSISGSIYLLMRIPLPEFKLFTTQCRIFTHLRYVAVENIMRKGEIACDKQFLHFSHCFLPNMALSFHFKCTLKCRLQFISMWASLKFCRLVIG